MCHCASDRCLYWNTDIQEHTCYGCVTHFPVQVYMQIICMEMPSIEGRGCASILTNEALLHTQCITLHKNRMNIRGTVVYR